MLIDNKIISAVKHIMEGLDADNETVAYDFMKQVGPGGNHLTHDHTAMNLEKSYASPGFGIGNPGRSGIQIVQRTSPKELGQW